MTKDLSKILCKIAGIEAKIGICDRELNPQDYSGECGFSNPTDFECNDCTNYDANLVVHPDLKLSDNFVKILETRIPNSGFCTIAELINSDRPWRNRDEALQVLIDQINSGCPVSYKLKQALQATDWVY